MINDVVEYREAVEELTETDKQLKDPNSELNVGLAKFRADTRSSILENIKQRRQEIADYVAAGNDTTPMHVPLQEWFSANREQDPNLIYRSGLDHQVMFVRDQLRIAGAGLSYDEYQKLGVMFVISYHTSKSVKLPVYSIERPDIGLRFVLRYNFYNWKLSVISETPTEADFSGLFHTTPPIEPEYTGDQLHPVYFEGFPRSLIFGYYCQNPKTWSAEISTDEKLWTTIFLIMRSLGHVKPFKWHTKKSHRAELDAEFGK